MSAHSFENDWLGELDQLCDRFEAGWKAGSPLPIEQFVADVELDRRSALARELIELEIQYRAKAGQSPTSDDYHHRFPALRAEIDGLFLQPTVIAADRRAMVASLPQPAQRIGDFEIIERLKAGGMGVVYKARQVSVNRLVALKLIRSGDAADSKEIARFQTEAEAAAKLEHQGIVPIFGSGSEVGQHYIAMAFIDGPSLAERIAQGPLPAREAAELVRRLAIAVDYAHRQGVIHRDLKPGNILLAPLDQTTDRGRGIWDDSPSPLKLVGNAADSEHPPTPASNQAATENSSRPRGSTREKSADAAELAYEPKITDFGLAKLLGSNRDITQTDEILGSWEYMPPEQASGRSSEAEGAADIYSLGAILYWLLTGRPPFQDANRAVLIQQIVKAAPIEPRLLAPGLHRDLETICLKCLEKDTSRRFSSAADLAQELHRFLRGEPILSRHIIRLERAWRWCRRNPLAVGLLGSLSIATLALMSTIYFRHLQKTEIEQSKKELVRLSFQSNARVLRNKLVPQRSLLQALGLIREGHWSQTNKSSPDPFPVPTANGSRHGAIENLVQAHRIRSDSDIRGEVAACLAFLDAVQIAGSADHRFQGPPGLRSLFPVANGKLVFAASHAGLITWKTDGADLILESAETSSGTVERTPIAVSPDEMLVARQSGHLIEIWECDAANGRLGRKLRGLSVTGKVRAAAFDPSNQLLAWSDDKKVAIWELTKAKLREFREGPWSCLAFDPTGEFLAMASEGGLLELRSVVSGELQNEGIKFNAKIHDLAWQPGGRELSVATSENVVRRLQMNSGNNAKVLVAGTGIFRSDESPDELQAVTYSPDGRYVAAGGTNGSVEIWDATNGQLVLTLPGSDAVNDIAWTRGKNGDTLFIANEMRFSGWRISFPEGYDLLKGSDHGEWLPTLAFSPDSRLLATANAGIIVKVWDAESGVLQHTLDVGSAERDVPWAASSRQRLTVHPSVAFSADGLRIAVGGPHEVKLFESKSGKELQSWKLERYAYQVLHFRPDGRLIAFQEEPSPEWQKKFAAGDRTPPENRVAVLRDVETGEYASNPPTLPGSERIAPYYLLGVFYLSDGTRVVLDGNPPQPRGMPNQKFHQFDSIYRLPDGAKLDLPFADTDPARIYPAGPGWWHVAHRQTGDTNRHELWHESNGQFTRKIELVGGPWNDPKTHYGIAVTADGRMALTGTNDEAAPAFIVWDISTKQELQRIPTVGSQPDFESMRLSPDGSKLAVSSRDGTVYLLNFDRLRTALKSYGLDW